MHDIPDPWSTALIEQNRRWLMAYFLSATGNGAAAEDLAQETFHIAFQKRDSFIAGTNFGGWLRTIAKNCLNRYFEKIKKQPFLIGDAISELDLVAWQHEEQCTNPDWTESRIAAMRKCLNRLSERVRLVIEHRYKEEKSSKEVSELLGMSPSAVDVATFRAKSMLAECIQQQMMYGQRR